MATGTVKFFNSQKGFGFIKPTDGSKDVFVHISAVERAGMTTLNEGQRLTYEVVIEAGGQPDVKIGPADVTPKVSSGNRGAPISGLFARAEKKYPGIEEEVGLSSAALRAGELVRGMRKAKGWTQTRLADELGWDQVRISNIERGEGTRGPTFDVLTKIADACGFDLQFTRRAEAPANVEKKEGYAEAATAEPRPIEPLELSIRPSRAAESES